MNRTSQIIERQQHNVTRAYQKNDIDYNALDRLVNLANNRKTAVRTWMNQPDNGDTIILERPLSQDEILDRMSYSITIVLNECFQPYAFNFPASNVTHRETGKCMPVKRFLKTLACTLHPVYKENILSYCGMTQTMVISCNPFFMLGSSVVSDGYQLDCSCHYPSQEGDYCSGPASYAVDRGTIGFFSWDKTNGGITGRQIVYLDIVGKGFVVGRKYGVFSETMSKFCRDAIYPLFSVSGNFGHTNNCDSFEIRSNGYAGYLDDGYFNVYRHNRNHTVTIELEEPVCITCGDSHDSGNLRCDSCRDSGRYTCDCCDDRLHEDDVCFSDNGDAYCYSCYHERYTRCHDCDSELYRDNDDIVDVRGYEHCADCAGSNHNIYFCGNCGEYKENVDDNGFCDDCRPAPETCGNCGEETDNVDNDGLCEDCREAEAVNA